MATTASSRLKAVDRTRSPHRNYKGPNKAAEPSYRRHKVAIGPIDFEQRREHIRLAYTKSIRESEALEARQKAAEKRCKEMEAAVQAKAEATAAISSPISGTATPDGSTHRELEVPGESVDVPPITSTNDLASVAAGVATLIPPTNLTIIPPVFKSAQPVVEVNDQAFDSPTLGLPGTFPALSPPMLSERNNERPKSSASGISETTEFDNEPQTNPPVQALSPLEVPITIVKPPSPQVDASLPKVEYHYPFEDDPESPRTIPQDSIQAMSRTAYDAVEMSERPLSPVIPGAFGDYDLDVTPVDEERPTRALFSVVPPEEAQSTLSFPRMDADDESDCQSDVDHNEAISRAIARAEEEAGTDVCTEATDDNDGAEECHSVSQCDGQLSSRRASTCDSSEACPEEDTSYPIIHNHPATSDTLSGLIVPPRLATERFSQQSAWTNFSVETSTDVTDSSPVPEQEDFAHGHVTIYETTSIHRGARTTYDSHQDQSKKYPRAESSRSSVTNSQHQLPELDTGDGFSIPYLSHRVSRNLSSHVPSPNHEPPPVPVSVAGSGYNSQRGSAAFYENSQYESTLISSERGSEDYVPTLATPHSLDSASIGTSEQYFAGAASGENDSKVDLIDKNGPDAKERHRLVQRRNVIKELVDTEAVFVRDMNIVEEIYKGTAEACPKLDGKTIKLIFRNTDEIIEFHTSFLSQIKEAVASVYAPQSRRSPMSRDDSYMSEPGQYSPGEIDDGKDRKTAIGPVFKLNTEKMKLAHEGFLRNSDFAAKQLIQIQQDPTVKVWLNECNEVAKDLTAAWDLDSLLIKPMQRITKYPNLIITLLQHTPQDHPDREALVNAKEILETSIIEINKTKKNFELVGQIVGRKRKESDVKAGFARAFGKRVDKLQASSNRPAEDTVYAKLNEKFGDDYLRLQVVLRDVEFYTRQVSAYVHEFLQYLSSIELVMRLQPGSYPELESKWVQFNISLRDLEKVALEEHLAQVRKHVIEPFELVIKAYGNPSLAMKKRQKRRVDYERYEQLKRAGKTPDAKLVELVEQYEALNDTLKKELPQLSALTEKIGNICLGNFVNIQAKWYGIWKDKMKLVLGDCPDMPDLKEVEMSFQRDHPYVVEQLNSIGILNPAYKGRASMSTNASVDEFLLKGRQRPSELDPRGRGTSINGDHAPSLPTPDFGKRHSGSFTMSPTGMGPTTTIATTNSIPSPHQYYYRDYYSGIHATTPNTGASMSPEIAGSSRSFNGTMPGSTRPSTGRSFDSGHVPRQSSESAAPQFIRDSHTYQGQESNKRYSGIFHSALPLPDSTEESQRSSRASSRERGATADGYNVLWLAASIFEFNINTTKHEAGYPYLIYQAGEIFDVIAEKGELWLAKNQDDPSDQVGWIWSKHFAKLADS